MQLQQHIPFFLFHHAVTITMRIYVIDVRSVFSVHSYKISEGHFELNDPSKHLLVLYGKVFQKMNLIFFFFLIQLFK